jgi:hypothetical protein
MGMGGIALFDVREGQKIAFLNDVHSVKAKFY